MEEDRLALERPIFPPPTPLAPRAIQTQIPQVSSFQERVAALIRRDIEGSDESEGEAAAAIPSPPRTRSPPWFGVAEDEWVEEAVAIQQMYDSINRGRGRTATPSTRNARI